MKNNKGFVEWIILGGILVLLILAPFIRLWLLPLFKFETKVNNAQKVIDKTYDADNQIYNYHWFKEREGSIAALDKQIVEAQAAVDAFESSAGPREHWTFEDKTEDARLRSIVMGLKNERHSQAEEYNARASEADRSIFQNGLKTFINLD